MTSRSCLGICLLSLFGGFLSHGGTSSDGLCRLEMDDYGRVLSNMPFDDVYSSGSILPAHQIAVHLTDLGAISRASPRHGSTPQIPQLTSWVDIVVESW